VDIAAHRLSLDPFELRALNAIPAQAFPYTLPSGARYDSGDFQQLLNTARTRSSWDNFEARAAEASTRGMQLGRGMSLFVEVSGGGGAPDEAKLTLSAQGNTPHLLIETVTASTGQSHARTFANIAKPRLGISEIDVTLLASDPNTRLSGAGSYASRSTIAAGSAVAQAADIIAAQVLGLAALRANCAAADLTLAEGVVKNQDGTTVCSIASLLSEPISATGKVAPTNAFASGCHVVEVEMEKDSGAITLVSYLAVDDGGVIIDHQAADAQIHGGIAQGVGEVLGEESATDSDGQMVAASFMDYRMPRAGDLPSYEVVDCGVPSPFNPIGVKGIGEAGTTGALCAVTSAVFNLLDGRDLPPMPFTCERMWKAMRS
jgi:carbon-monoxide dehydrogenase large subunit